MARKGIVHELEDHNAAFSLVFIGIFTVTFSFLYVIDVVPDPTAKWKNAHGGTAIVEASTQGGASASAQGSGVTQQPELPVRIVVDEIGMDATIGNPETTDAVVLDQFLKSGSVRYPTSAMLGVNGTVVLFGHSSYLPVVANPAFKTFTDIQKLKPGADISVYSGEHEYRYEVTRVYKVAASDGVVELKSDGKYLTLVTCDSFNKRLSDRWIVESKLVGVYSIVS